MRRRLFSWRGGIGSALAAVLLCGLPLRAHAQGGLVLLFPMGARAIAMGEAGTTLAAGSGAVWWNPALIARTTRDVSFDLSSNASEASSEVAAVVAIPIRGVGGVAFSIHYLNEGEEPATNSVGDSTGSFVPTDIVVGATFAAPFGNRFAVGFTAKVLEVSLPCTGTCLNPSSTPTTGALDIGTQYILTADSTFIVGAALRDLGYRLTINDAPQSDRLPERAQFGVAFAPHVASWPKEARLRVVADVVKQLVPNQAVDQSSMSYRIGGEFSWMERYHARAGYVQNGPNGGSGLTFGVGLTNGNLAFDFAQALTDVSIGSTGKPTYFTFRYAF